MQGTHRPNNELKGTQVCIKLKTALFSVESLVIWLKIRFLAFVKSTSVRRDEVRSPPPFLSLICYFFGMFLSMKPFTDRAKCFSWREYVEEQERESTNTLRDEQTDEWVKGGEIIVFSLQFVIFVCVTCALWIHPSLNVLVSFCVRQRGRYKNKCRVSKKSQMRMVNRHVCEERDNIFSCLLSFGQEILPDR